MHCKPKPCIAHRELPVSQFPQGKTCFHYREPLFSLQGPCFHYRDFPVNPCTSLLGIAVYFLPTFRKTFLCFQGGFLGKFCPYVWLVFKRGLWWRAYGTHITLDCFLNQIFSFEPLTEDVRVRSTFFPFSFVERHLTL